MAALWTDTLADLSGNATSSTLDLEVKADGWSRLSVQIVSASAARGGTLALQVSNDNTNWEDLAWVDENGAYQTSLTITASQAFSEIVHLGGIYSRYFRVNFTDSASGAGAGTITINRKRW